MRILYTHVPHKYTNNTLTEYVRILTIPVCNFVVNVLVVIYVSKIYVLIYVERGIVFYTIPKILLMVLYFNFTSPKITLTNHMQLNLLLL